MLAFLTLVAAAVQFASAASIMPLGDSVTYGCGDSCESSPYDCTTNSSLDCPNPLGPRSCHGGYRTRLHALLAAAGVDAVFVGPLTTGPSVAPATATRHAGYSGALVGPTASKWSLTDLFANWTAPAYAPDVVLLLGGTNDVWAGVGAPKIANDVRTLVARAAAVWPRATFLIASILAMPQVNNATVAALNAALPGTVAALRAAGVNATFVDVAAATRMCPPEPTALCCLQSDVHPSAAGYDRLAAAWLPAVLTAIGQAQDATHLGPPSPQG